MSVEWRVEQNEQEYTVFLSGTIDEDSDLMPVTERAGEDGANEVIVHLKDVRRINSFGVREWVNFIRDFSAKHPTTLVYCSPAIVAQLNMVGNFSGEAKIESIMLPYVCDECGEELEIFADLPPSGAPALPTPVCPNCSSEMEFDDVEEAYFSFL